MYYSSHRDHVSNVSGDTTLISFGSVWPAMPRQAKKHGEKHAGGVRSLYTHFNLINAGSVFVSPVALCWSIP